MMKFKESKRALFLFSLIFLFSANPAFSQDEKPAEKIEIITTDVDEDWSTLNPEQQKKKLAELVSAAEEASEGGEDPNQPRNQVMAFAREYASKLNFPKIVRGMYRWYNVMEEKYPSIAADLSIMLLASHTTEMLSGPVGVALASASHAPQWVQWTIGVTGGVISVPGLDPLCIALGVAYVKLPRFRKGVTGTRIIVMKVVSATGVDRFLNWFVQKQSRIDFIRKAIDSEPGKFNYLVAPEEHSGMVYEFKNSLNETFSTVEFERSANGHVSAKSVTFNAEAAKAVSSKQFATMLGLFNGNITNAVSQAFKSFKTGKLESLKSQYHITDVQHFDASQVVVSFRPNALKLTDKRTWSQSFRSLFSCNGLLKDRVSVK